MFGQRPSLAASSRPRAALPRLLLLATVAMTVSGCMTSARQETVGSIPTDYRLRHPISIREGEQNLEIFVGTRRGELTAAQRSEVAAFAGSWRSDATGGLVLSLPSAGPNARASAQAAAEVRSILARAGVPPQAVAVRRYRPDDPGTLATLRLTYPKMQAKAGPCGLWPNDLGPTSDTAYNHNGPYWNLGCASQRNLAAMVVNPADLVQPRAETPIYAARRTTVFDKYRKGESSATNYPNPDKGAISDVGK